VNALLVVYGPRTTAILYNNHQQKVQEFTLMEDHWIVSHDNIKIQGPCKIFSPGNLRCANDIAEYFDIISGWMKRGLTLRYTGGLILDVAQIFIKKQGIFCNIGSVNHKCKLRVLYELAAVAFLIEKAGGKSLTAGKICLMDY
jgi:fructose-1,6-bisphosphatase